MATGTRGGNRDMVDVSKEGEPAKTVETSKHAAVSADDEKDAPFIVRFYGKTKALDDEDRTLDDICAFSNDELEYHHDYIQILFPLPERSPVNPDAPLITKATRDAFVERAYLRKSFFRAFTCMAHFYGFDVNGDETAPTLTPKANFKKIARNSWLTYMDHNHLRITRIIRALRILGLDAVAQVFFKALRDNAQGVSPRSLMYWERAAKRPLYLPPDQPDNSSKIIAWLKDD